MFSLITASGAVGAAIRSLEVINETTEAASFVRSNLTRLWLTVALMAGFLVAFAALVIAGPIFGSIADDAGLGDAGRTIVSIGRYPIGLAALLGATLLLYTRGPAGVRRRLVEHLPGALLAAALWVLASIGFSFYVSHFSSYDATYGSLGAVIVLLIWIYVSADRTAARRARQPRAAAGTRTALIPPLAFDPGSSLDNFIRGAEEFFHRLGDIGWPAMALGLAFYLAHLLARTRAWQNVLQAAYPTKQVPYSRITAAYFAGAGLNSFIPARIGDAVKIFLAKRSIRGSSYPAIVSSFFVQSVFDTTAGVLVFVYALTQGLLPRPPSCRTSPPSTSPSGRENPRFLIFFVTALAIGVVILFAYLARRVEAFWDRIKQGVVVLTDPGLYLRSVASWQAVAWVMRFFAFWFFLEAFNIGGSFSNVMIVMSVQAIATLLPFTPGGAGAQQALLVATLVGPGPIAVLTYSVGQQIAIAVWAAVLGFLALAFVFRTTDWRTLIRSASNEADQQEERPQPG